MKVKEEDFLTPEPIKVGKLFFETATKNYYVDGKLQPTQGLIMLNKGGEEYGFWSMERVMECIKRVPSAKFLSETLHDFDELSMNGRFNIKLGWESKAKFTLMYADKDTLAYQIPMIILLCEHGDIATKRKKELSEYAPNAVIIYADISSIYAGILISMIGIGFKITDELLGSFDEDIIKAAKSSRAFFGGKGRNLIKGDWELTVLHLITEVFQYNTQVIDLPNAQSKRSALRYGMVGAGSPEAGKLKPFTINSLVRKRISMVRAMIDRELEEHTVIDIKDLYHMLQAPPFGMMYTAIDAFILGKVISEYEGKTFYIDRCFVSKKRGFAPDIVRALVTGAADNMRFHSCLFSVNKDLTAYINIGAEIKGRLQRDDPQYYWFANFTQAVINWSKKNRIYLSLLNQLFMDKGDEKNAEISEDISRLVKILNRENADLIEAVRLAEKIGRTLRTPKAMRGWMDASLELTDNYKYREMVRFPRSWGAPPEAMWWLYPPERLREMKETAEKYKTPRAYIERNRKEHSAK